MRKLTVAFAVIVLLSACAPATPSVAVIRAAIEGTREAWTPEPSQTARIKVVNAVQTVIVVHTVVVAATDAGTSTPAPSPAPTQDETRGKLGDGFYLVGSDIAPGVWRSDGSGDKCYWSVTTDTGDIIDNHYGMAGGTMFIPGDAFQVEVSNCGNWVFLK